MSNIFFEVSANPFGWVFASLPGGRRVTKDMVKFCTLREDVHVNKYGVVHFYDAELAKLLLADFVDPLEVK